MSNLLQDSPTKRPVNKNSQLENDFFSSSDHPDRLRGPPNLIAYCGSQRVEHEADHSPPSNVEDKKVWRGAVVLPLSCMSSWLGDGQLGLGSMTTNITMGLIEVRWIRRLKTVTGEYGKELLSTTENGEFFESLNTCWLTGICYNNI
jgi:hypothetical protein